MRILAGPRDSGKTRTLIQLAKSTNGYILVHSEMAYKYVTDNGMSRDRILRVGDLRAGSLRGRKLDGPIYVDNMELIFRALLQEVSSGVLSMNLAAATISLSQEDIDLMFNKLVIEDIIIDPK